VTTADSLPGPLAVQLLATASDAFTSGLHLAAVIGAVAFALLAVLASVMFGTSARTARSRESRSPTSRAMRSWHWLPRSLQPSG